MPGAGQSDAATRTLRFRFVRPSGSIDHTARSKATITLDRAKVDRAAALVDITTMSDVIDLALDHLIRAEELRRDIAAYRRSPADDDELAIAELPITLDLDDDDVDYDAAYGRVS
jgi:hypothetical protein